MINWPLDVLVVATPDRFHIEQTLAASKKGIPVLLEKPIAEDTMQGFRCAFSLIEGVTDPCDDQEIQQD